MTLASVNAEESLFSRQYSGRLDTSQDGNWCNFRNGTLNKLPFVLTNENIDELPRKGVLEFDYVNTTRPPADVHAVSDERFAVIMRPLGAVVNKKVWKALGQFSISELALAVCQEYFTIDQVILLMNCLPEGSLQTEVVSISSVGLVLAPGVEGGISTT
jgi:hypothetical protein